MLDKGENTNRLLRVAIGDEEWWPVITPSCPYPSNYKLKEDIYEVPAELVMNWRRAERAFWRACMALAEYIDEVNKK